MTPDAFHAFLCDPKTTAILEAMLADNARVDAELAAAVVSAPSLKVICAWCGITQREGSLPASHGICPTCQGVV